MTAWLIQKQFGLPSIKLPTINFGKKWTKSLYGRKGDIGTLVRGTDTTTLSSRSLGVQAKLSIGGVIQFAAADWEVTLSTPSFILSKASLYKADNYITLRSVEGEVGASFDKEKIKLFFTLGVPVSSFALQFMVPTTLFTS